MSSLNINSLISTTRPLRGLVSPLAGPDHGAGSGPVKGTEQQGDTFTQGQWWKNHAIGQSGVAGNGYPVYTMAAGAGQGLRPASADQRSQAGGQVDSPARADDQARSVTGTVAEAEGGRAVEPQKTAGLKKPNGELLSQPEMAVLEKLEAVDIKVRAHEMAHLTAAGGYAKGGASFSYQRGPDGKNYAVGGEVQIDFGKESSPAATINKMKIVRRAALAPADPSPQDQRVAAQATIQIAESSKERQLVEQSGQEAVPQFKGRAESGEGGDKSAGVVYQDHGQSLISGGNPGSEKPALPSPYVQAPERSALNGNSLDILA